MWEFRTSPTFVPGSAEVEKWKRMFAATINNQSLSLPAVIAGFLSCFGQSDS